MRLYLFLAVFAAVLAFVVYSNLNDRDSDSLGSGRPVGAALSSPTPARSTDVLMPSPSTPSPSSAIAAADDDPPEGRCLRAAPAALSRIESRPAKGMGSIIVPSGYVVQGERGQVIGGFLTSEDPTVPVDGEFGAWFLQPDGSLFSYFGAAIDYTDWPQIGDGGSTARISEARACAEGNAG